ncbi:unnamed protein product [Notodromas monacha]|uniref:Rho GTPase-activating protein 21 n=1 Tax=Notodromas monacha TaxID=399045 RepID=A0A7R9GFW4_9CRUS|nr:unnamed protein product [Notodromas monacha]CAG0919567.1 unnamed protein product [Notodromas monacha]
MSFYDVMTNDRFSCHPFCRCREGSGQSGVNRLLALFGDKSDPNCVKASSQPGSAGFGLEDSVARQGTLSLKTVMIDGKRAGDRSWKTGYAVLRSSLLYFRPKENRSRCANSPLGIEEQPAVDVRGSCVELASDYTKKKNVFRIFRSSPQSEYLLQADTASELNLWLQSLQEAAGVAKDAGAVFGSCDESTHELAAGTATTPSVAQPKGIKKLTTSLRHRSPSGHSPVSKTRKPSQASLMSTSGPASLSCPEPSLDATLPSPKARTWRGRVARQFRRIQHHNTSGSQRHSASSLAEIPEGATIGIPIENCPMCASNECLPVLVEVCISIVESKGLNTIGVYRVPGNSAAVSALTESLNKGFDQVDMTDAKWSDVNVISSLLKSFFRKLPDPLVSSHLYSAFMDAATIEDPVHHLLQLKKLVRTLPEVNYETLRYLILHLAKLSANQAVNKMDPKNLAIVFGPNLIRGPDQKVSTMVSDMAHHYRILESLIVAAEWIFEEDDELNPERIPHEALERRGDERESPSFTSANHSLYLNNAIRIQDMTGASQLSAGIHETKNSLVSSVISAAHRKTKLSSSSIKSGSVSEPISIPGPESGKRPKKEISSPLTRKENYLVTKSDEAMSSVLEEDVGPRSLPPLPTPDQMRVRSECPALGPLSANTAGLSSSADDVVKMDTRQHQPEKTSEDGSVMIRSYAGLIADTQKRIRKFEEETKAIMQIRPVLESRVDSSDLSGGSSASVEAARLNSSVASDSSYTPSMPSYPKTRMMAPLPLPSGLPPHMQPHKPGAGPIASNVVLRPPAHRFFQAGATLRRGISAENLSSPAAQTSATPSASGRTSVFDASKIVLQDTLRRARFPRTQPLVSSTASASGKQVAPQIVMSPVAEEACDAIDGAGASAVARRPSHHVRYGSLDSLREFLPAQEVKEEDLMQSITASLDERLKGLRSSVNRKENLYMPLPSVKMSPKSVQLKNPEETEEEDSESVQSASDETRRQYRDPSLHRISALPAGSSLKSVGSDQSLQKRDSFALRTSKKLSSSEDDRSSIDSSRSLIDSNQNLSGESGSQVIKSSRRVEERSRSAKSTERRPVQREERSKNGRSGSGTNKDKLTRSESLSKTQRSQILALISQGVLPTREGNNLPLITSSNGGNVGGNSKRDTKVKASVKELKEMFEKGLSAGSGFANTVGAGLKQAKTGKKGSGRKIKRRHTVGGTKDFEKFRRVIQQACTWSREGKSSLVWDRSTSGDADQFKAGWMRTSSPELSPKTAPVGGINWVAEIMSQEAAVAAANGLVNLEDLERFKRNSLQLGPIFSYALQSKV